jgi:hypothetical protein
MEKSDKPPDTTDDLQVWVICTRVEQGLPPHIEDLATLLQVIEVLGLAHRHNEAD